MRHIGLASVLGAVWLLPGCRPSPMEMSIGEVSSTVERRGVIVGLGLPKREFSTGESFELTVAAYNSTNRSMQIVARTGAPCYVRVYRYTGLAWQQVRRYPEAATMVMNPWTLPPRAQRRFMMRVTVGPDWPTSEPLRITGELNGFPDAAPGLIIEVVPAAETEGARAED